jgi:hypothetical protein
LPGSITAATPTWSYLRDIDKSWGCGSSEKVVAVRGGWRRLLHVPPPPPAP